MNWPEHFIRHLRNYRDATLAIATTCALLTGLGIFLSAALAAMGHLSPSAPVDLAHAFSDFPTWFIPEKKLSIAFMATVGAVALVLAYFAKEAQRRFEKFGVNFD